MVLKALQCQQIQIDGIVSQLTLFKFSMSAGSTGCVSNVLCSTGVVEIYDSLPAYSMGSFSVEKQAAVMMKTIEATFELKIIDVQHQSGGSDCGLFAIAFAMALCSGKDPHLLTFDQSKMRAHFIKCIEMQDNNNFPPYERPRRLGRRRCMSMKEVRVYCTC